jgi:hypothetical protein
MAPPGWGTLPSWGAPAGIDGEVGAAGWEGAAGWDALAGGVLPGGGVPAVWAFSAAGSRHNDAMESSGPMGRFFFN